MEESDKKIFGYISGNNDDNSKHTIALKEQFKSEVNDKDIKFPKELGVEHPFDFKQVEKTLDNIGLANAAVDKIVDAIIGDFTVKTKDSKSQEIIDGFIKDSDFLKNIRPWVKEAISKGNGPLDLTDIQNNKIQTLNANYIYVKRNKNGDVKEYNQFFGNLEKYSANKQKVITFKPNEIAFLKINDNPGDAYGIGLVYPNMRTLDHYASAEIDLHKLISRKAGAPYHIKVGQPGVSVPASVVDEVKSKLQFMNNRTEWATDANVEIKVLEFKDVGKNLTDAAMHDVEQFAIGMQIPMSLLGVANIPEGLAKVNLEGFQRFTQSVRVIIEDILENEVFKRVLNSNGLDDDIEFTWEMPGEEEKNLRLQTLNTLMQNMYMSPEMRKAIEIEVAQILGLQEVIKIMDTPKEVKKQDEERQEQMDADRETEEEEIKQPEVPGEKPTAKNPRPPKVEQMQNEVVEEESVHICTETCTCNLSEEAAQDMTIQEYVNITEIPGFNYTDYLVKILQKLRIDKFEELRALSEQDLLEGLLPESDIEKLRVVLNDGFKKNRTIREIERDINQSINLKDRVKFDETGQKIITLSAEARPLVIARTETVRLANAGLKDLYQENDVKKYRYLAAMDDRTSEICQSLNGRVFDTTDGMPGVNMPPMHVNCRSTIIGLVE